MPSLVTEGATDRSQRFVNRGGCGYVRFNNSSRRRTPCAREEQLLSYYTFPRPEKCQGRRRPTSGDVEGATMCLQDLVTSYFGARLRDDREIQTADEESHPKATLVFMAALN